MRWLSRSDDDREEQTQAPEAPASPSDGPDTAPGDDLWGADENGVAGPAAPVQNEQRPAVPVDLGTVDPTELGRATRRAVARALAEDLGDRGDVTSLATVPAGRRGTGVLVARNGGVIFGVEVVLHVFEQVDTRVEVVVHVEDGARVEAGQTVATIAGPLGSILTGERVALNFLGHLSGVATQTRRFVDAAGPDVAIRDTRKTTPGLRLLEKAAVRAGGGHNHRIGLYDALLVKDNHIIAAGGVEAALEAAFSRGHGRHVQVEVRDLSELEAALRAGATDVLLDNFDPEQIRQAVTRTAGRAALEASGNIDVDTVRAYASAGVDRIAVGRLTHSTPWLDVALDLLETEEAPSGRADAQLWTTDEEHSPLAAVTGLNVDESRSADHDPDGALDALAAVDTQPDTGAGTEEETSSDPEAEDDARTEDAEHLASQAPVDEPGPTTSVEDGEGGDDQLGSAGDVHDQFQSSGDADEDGATTPVHDEERADADVTADGAPAPDEADDVPFDGESLFAWRDQAVERDSRPDSEA